MDIIRIDQNNIEHEHICCALGNDKANKIRAGSKKQWLKERFKEGLVFKRLNDRGKVFIEYMPIEKVWKPISGTNFMVINCLWVAGKFKKKGYSSRLLEECINEARAKKMAGVAVVTSTKVMPFLTDKKFYAKHGFVTVDKAPPYFELMVLKWDQKAGDPAFSGNARQGTCSYQEGLAFIYCNQCPFMEEYVALLAGAAEKRAIPYQIQKLTSAEQARQIASPFGTLGIYYRGEFKRHDLMTEAKFDQFLDSLD